MLGFQNRKLNRKNSVDIEKKKAEQIKVTTMDNKRRSKILLPIINKFYEENPSIEESLHKSMVDIGREENISPHQVLFILFSFYLLCLS